MNPIFTKQEEGNLTEVAESDRQQPTEDALVSADEVEAEVIDHAFDTESRRESNPTEAVITIHTEAGSDALETGPEVHYGAEIGSDSADTHEEVATDHIARFDGAIDKNSADDCELSWVVMHYHWSCQ